MRDRERGETEMYPEATPTSNEETPNPQIVHRLKWEVHREETLPKNRVAELCRNTQQQQDKLGSPTTS